MLERLERLLGIEKLEKIKNLKVAVIGLGGVGGYVVESLVRTGIKEIIIVDYDKIDISNLNRQIIANKTNIGKNKADEFEKRINNISDTKVTKISKFLDSSNIQELFDLKPDFIVDACDTVTTKIEIIKLSLQNNIKFISCMGTGNRLDPTQFKIEDIKKTSYDPLAKKVRKLLKEQNIKGNIPVLYSKEPPVKVSHPVGSNSFVPATAGLLCTRYVINEVIK